MFWKIPTLAKYEHLINLIQIGRLATLSAIICFNMLYVIW